MGGDTRDEAEIATALADGSGGEERSRLAARAYRPARVEVDEALRHNWLELWYQPKVDLQRKSLVGAEALARIRHPELGILLPKSFLPDISETALAHLTEHAMLTALRNWSAFDQAGANLQLSVNVPVSALRSVAIADLVRQHRPSAKHWPGLTLEVPENEIVRDLDLSRRLASDLRSARVSISIDNFGAGSTSFSGLRELPFAELKLDHGFVKNCAVDATNAAICQAVIDLAHRFGSAVAAKGIERTADLHALQVMNCDFGQGVLIAPPMPMQGLLDLLQQRYNKPMVPSMSAEAPSAQARPPSIDRVA
jgi:EAL domain-containing protein (putative c-di-GMP-specific phosphodiesterase class I)